MPNKLMIILTLFVAIPITLFFISTRQTNTHVGIEKYLLSGGEGGGDTKRLVNNISCVRQTLYPFGNDMMRHFRTVAPVDCAENENWVIEKNGFLEMSPSVSKTHRDAECTIKFIKRKSDLKNSLDKEEVLRVKSKLELKRDFFKAQCKNESNSGVTYDNIQAAIRKLKVDSNNHSCRKGPGFGLDVMVLGFDSISHMTYMRLLNKTYHYFNDVMKGTILDGYNVIGDGTGHALTPMLTGTKEKNLPSALKTKANTVYVNKWPFVWDRYKSAGYITMYNEDQPHIGTYTYRLNGFKEQPTDHYMRTFFTDAVREFKKHKSLCLGDKRRTRVFLDYLKDFQVKYNEECKFSFVFHSEVSHDDTSRAMTADDDIYETIKFMHENGYLNNTLLFLMSDHGARFSSIRQTLQGKLEERLPFFGIWLPAWWHKKYPKSSANVRENSNALLTPYDIHTTLEHVLDFDPDTKSKQNKHGISVFNKIPKTRTCADANIGTHWCTCLKWREIDNNSLIAQTLSSLLVRTINNFIFNHTDLCESVEHQQTVSVAYFEPEEDLMKFKESKGHEKYDMSGSTKTDINKTFQITIETSPGSGMFEASFDTTKGDTFRLKDEVSRINKYGSAANCVEQKYPDLRKFCYCKHTNNTASNSKIDVKKIK